MIFNLIVVGLVLGLAYAWMVRGFFNAFIHLVCVLIAGAIAFALWEPLSLLVLRISPERGFFDFIESAAWGVGLLLPFVVVLLLTRLATDKIIKANIRNSTPADYAGGAVCGLAVGVLTTGVFVIGIQSLRLPTNFFGYQPVWYSEDRASGAGSLEYSSRLWIPADRIVAGVYRNLSEGSMSAEQSLAKWYPDLEIAGFAARISPGDGAGRNIIKPGEFRVTKTYTVGSPERPLEANALLAFEGSATPQRYIDVRGERPGRGYLMGVVIEFGPEAKERGGRGGQLIVSNGQVHMIARNAGTGESRTIFPIAAISEGADADGRIGRWKFDANDVFISSVGGQSQSTIGFEFIVPEGFEPIGLSVRQARTRDLPEPTVFESTAQRDLQVTGGQILRAGDRIRRVFDESHAAVISTSGQTAGLTPDSGIRIGPSLGEMMASQNARSRLTLTDDNEIAEGQSRFSIQEIGRSNVPMGRTMRVDSFALGRNQTLIQIEVSANRPTSFLSEAGRLAPTNRPIILVDANGNEYQAIGFTYKDRELFEVRYTPGSTLGGIADTPPISTARDDQTLWILFIVTSGVDIEKMAVGDIVLARFEPVLAARSR